jgi:hypothetical protein
MAVTARLSRSTSAFTEISTRNAERLQVADQLADFKRTAFEMRREADTLDRRGGTTRYRRTVSARSM